MRVLVMGGTWFLGRAVVREALGRGWEVTTFNRGRSGIDADGVEAIRGDRTAPEDLRRLSAAGPWDAVVDTSGYVPVEVLASARELAGVVGRYVFVSTVSVYEGWPVEPLSEDSPILECPPDAGAGFGADDPRGYPTQYGFQKAGAERAVLEVFGADRTTVLRPGVILGPGEYVGRLPWWLRRAHASGRMLAPGDPHQPIQPVDVRDVAGFALDQARSESAGVFNVTAPPGHATFGTMLAACAAASGSHPEFEWIPDKFLIRQGVRQWTELPLWRTYPGTWRVDGSRAHAAGLMCRPLSDTVAETWAWMTTGGALVENERAGEIGMSAERERAVLAAWDARPPG